MKENEVIDTTMREDPCPISRTDFLVAAKDLVMDLHGKKIVARPGDLKPDRDGRSRFGWIGRDKGSLRFGDVDVPVKIVVQITCVGSKEAAP